MFTLCTLNDSRIKCGVEEYKLLILSTDGDTKSTDGDTKGPVLETQITMVKDHYRSTTWNCSGKQMFLEVTKRINKLNNWKPMKRNSM